MFPILRLTLIIQCLALPAAAAENDKVSLCHYDGKARPRIISVSANAVPAHAKHGDHPTLTFFADQDRDTFGVAGSTVTGCEAPPGFALIAGDCDDTNASINPGAPEVCADGLDNDCDGQIDENCTGCVEILIDCSPTADVIATVCGSDPQQTSESLRFRASFIRFGPEVSGAILTSCDGVTVTVTANTSFCDLEGGCCGGPPRFNDNICTIDLF